MWLNCGLPGWTGPASVCLAWLAWLPHCLACRVDCPGLGAEVVVAAEMATVPDVPVASVPSASRLPTGAKVVPVFWEKGGGPFGRRTKFGETN